MRYQPHSSGTSRRWALLTLALAMAANACAIGVDRAARPVADAPDDLFSTTTSSTVPEAAEPGFPLDLYFYYASGGGGLVVVRRPRDIPATPQDALVALAGPTTEEFDEYGAGVGLVSALGLSTYTARTPDADGVLQIDVQGIELRSFAANEPDKLIAIYSQIVCTMDALDIGIAKVLLLDAEGPIPVRKAGAAAPDDLPADPANLGDVCATAVPPPTTTTTTLPRSTRRPVTTTTTTTLPSASVPGDTVTTALPPA